MQIFSLEEVFSENRSIIHPILDRANVFLDIKREDKLHPEVSGNKFRKLKYNLFEAKKLGYTTLLTFGGAFSNHIAAVSAAGKGVGLQTIGIIRGEELGVNIDKTLLENDTLQLASKNGMHLKFISREKYRSKKSIDFLSELKQEFGSFYLLPEGGTNPLAVKGCEEILSQDDKMYDVICCPVGTGGTISGVINSSTNHQKVLGFPALKGDFLSKEIAKYTSKMNWNLIFDYHFGGYSKVNEELITFINVFKKEQQILLDPVYTSKMIFGIFDMVKKG